MVASFNVPRQTKVTDFEVILSSCQKNVVRLRGEGRRGAMGDIRRGEGGREKAREGGRDRREGGREGGKEEGRRREGGMKGRER